MKGGFQLNSVPPRHAPGDPCPRAKNSPRSSGSVTVQVMANARVVCVNVGCEVAASWAGGLKRTAIDKRPVTAAVPVGTLGVDGDVQSDKDHHGGPDQALYAYAREDLDSWEAELGRRLGGGVFGENLTTRGLDVTGALVGERWRLGNDCVLQVCAPRIPCRTFAGWLSEHGWVRRFTERGNPGAYLRVVIPGRVRAGDPIVIEDRPGHDVSIGLMFRALTTQKHLLPQLLAAGDALPEETRRSVLRRRADSA